MDRWQELFEGSPVGLAVAARVVAAAERLGGVTVRVTRSQVALRRDRAFAWLWRPTTYLGPRAADVVLTVALGRHDASPRWKEVVHPSPRHWVHHLELAGPDEVDDEVVGWLVEAHARAVRR